MSFLNKLTNRLKKQSKKVKWIKILSKKSIEPPTIHIFDEGERKLLTFKKDECEYISRYQLEMDSIHPVGCDIFIFSSDFKKNGIFSGCFIYDQIGSDNKLILLFLKIRKENNLILVNDKTTLFSIDLPALFDYTIDINEYKQIKDNFKEKNIKYIGKKIKITSSSNITKELDYISEDINLLYIDTPIDTARVEVEINKIKRHKYLIYFKDSGYEKELESLNLEWIS
ncbi:hypothetical protein [Shewanella surugensis]|uniref:Uncharacterized protein n=1 Tax=Shewanella surugensis TaxID=212020 RepID=A0ABT0LGK3_9GAMM|nr:hypothetical protein [Shewanella surugensis]MCL1126842.1 hypothetical protein [Shewanella surugensis]